MPSAMDVTAQTEYIKCLVTGMYGTGKSVFASSFPTKGFVFDFSNGILTYRGKDFEYEQYSHSPVGWTKFQKDLTQVEVDVKEGKYETVVIDDTTGQGMVAMEQALKLDPKRSSTGGPLWNVHYQMVRNLMEGTLRRVYDMNCNIVIICHLEIEKDQETGAIIDIHPMLTGQLATILPGLFDEVYLCSSIAQGQDSRFVVQTFPRGLYKARSRISGKARILPDYIENDYKSLMYYAKQNKTKEERDRDGKQKGKTTG